jgi:hypothetical protein
LPSQPLTPATAAPPPAPPPSVSPPQSAPVASPPPPQPDQWVSQDDTTYAAQSFAQFFNGVMVDLPPEDIPSKEVKKAT